MEHGREKKSVSRRKFVATMGAAGLGAVLAAGLGSRGTAYASVTDDTVTSYDTMALLQAASNLQPGTFVYTKGFYKAGDGGGAYWNVLDSGTADDMFVYACADGKRVSLIHDKTINIKQIGIRADGKKEPNQYPTGLENFPTSLAGTTRDFWVSESGSETSNFNKLKAIVSAGYNVYVPKGIYVFAGKSTIHVKNGLCFIGESMGESILIGLGFTNYGKLEECNDILFENFTMDNYTSILPPVQNTIPPVDRKLKYPGEVGFADAKNWNPNDYKSFSYRGGDYRSNIANAMHFANASQEIKNITVRRVKVKNYWCGFGFGTKTPTGPMVPARDITVEECVFENIMFQPLGTNNVQNVRFLCNSFDNIGLQACDFSRGSIGCEFTGNYVTRASSMLKVEGHINDDFTRVLSDQFIIRDNIYKQPPALTDWQYESKFVIDNLTGDGLVSGNFLEMGFVHQIAIFTYIRRQSIDDTVLITNNHFVTPTSSKHGWACMFSVQRQVVNKSTSYPSAGKNIIFENNHVTMRTSTVGCFLPLVTNATQIALRNNLFVSDGAGYVLNLVRGCSEHLEISGNSVDRVQVVLETDLGGLRELDTKTILVTDNRLFSDYTNNSAALGEPLIHVTGHANNKTERIEIRGNYTNRSRLLKAEKMKFIRIDVTDNVMQENDGNTAQFGCQPLAVDALVDDLNFEGNTVWFPNQTTYGGILAFLTTNNRNVKRLVMENNTLSLSGPLATGAPSGSLKPEVFLFRNNKVYKVQSNPSIAIAAVKGSVSFNLFDSPDVEIGGYMFKENNQNIGGTINGV
ncbi:hypothetical protein SAMN02799630_04426 [Paenibacillus sp. UNCCL117]|uniref:hypothetical protein n=1 Tax=unclassified Paenibacillus TaxID=185978 RepID=UPI00087F7FB4|nr:MULTISPECIES: hypothetical protein [unclassified Paenibacillus]SDE02296.1 hypothetical protein SAMN04488602_11735 [Paenibacillus sp. cl123]SFW57185.1 hypothetical protein SAMN02799630_04426 [Paenibacillus sp. UNCCL117]